MGRKKDKKEEVGGNKVYRLLIGSHNEKGVTHVAGLNDQIVSDKPLDEMFVNKFTCLGKEGAVDKEPIEDDKFDSIVTEEFIVEGGVSVGRKGSWYFVVKDGTIQNEKGLRKEEVQDFIETLQSEDKEDEDDDKSE